MPLSRERNRERTSRTRLTAKQEAFAVNYFTMRNATQAAIKAGYPEPGAHTMGYENLRKPAIVARLQELHAETVPCPEIANAAVAVVKERLQILTRIARHKIETPVSAGHINQSIAELNKMEHIYEPGGNIRDVNVVFIIGRGYKDVPLLKEAKDEG